jgi:hypothetical protein
MMVQLFGFSKVLINQKKFQRFQSQSEDTKTLVFELIIYFPFSNYNIPSSRGPWEEKIVFTCVPIFPSIALELFIKEFNKYRLRIHTDGRQQYH